MARVRADDASEDDKVFIKEPYMQDMQPFLGSNRKGVCDFLLNMTVQRGAVLSTLLGAHLCVFRLLRSVVWGFRMSPTLNPPCFRRSSTWIHRSCPNVLGSCICTCQSVSDL